ncbi:MAG: DNA repair protein RecO [Bacteroidetes bacterium]|nr:DNA repair protein RecO [Bacteroidota bacterium]
MIVKTQAICIKNTRFGESGMICKFFTLDRGLTSFLVQGLNRKSSMIKSSHLMPGNTLEIIYYKKPTSNINRLKELKLINSFYVHEVDVVKNAVLQFVLEIIAKTNEEEVSDIKVFYFIKKTIDELKRAKSFLKYFPVIFLCKYLTFTGWYPNFDTEYDNENFSLKEGRFIRTSVQINDANLLDKKESDVLYSVFQIAEKQDYNTEINEFNHKKIIGYLITYFEIHLLKGKKIKSPEILSEIFA